MSEKVLVDKKGLETYHKILRENMLKISFDLIEELTDAKGVFEQIERGRQINENTRKSNEIKRVSDENKRVEAEKLREQAIEKVKSDNAKLIADTKKEITDYKNAKDTAINNDLKQFKGVTTQSIEEYKNVKDMEITNNLNSYKTSKDKEIDLYKSNKDTLINNKIAEIEQAKTSLTNDVALKINEVTNVERVLIAQVDEAVTNMNDNVNAKLEEADNRITELQNFESQLEQIENKNIEQDTRLKQVEYKNKVQDVYISGLFNENNDKRLTIEGEGNSLKLEGSKEGLVEVEKVVGNTMVTLSDNTGKWYFSDRTAWLYPKEGILASKPFKPNTLYTLIIFNLPSNFHRALMHRLSTDFIYSNIGTFTTGEDVSKATGLYLYSQGTNFVQEELDKVSYIILEGDYTNKPIPSEYFEGMQSTFENQLVTQEMVDSGEESVENLGKYKCNVKVRGKNLFDGKIVQGTIADATANEATVPSSIRSGNFVKVEYGKTYYLKYDALSANAQQGYPKIYYYDANMNYLVENTPIAIGGGTFTVTNRNCKFIKFRIFAASQYTFTPNDISNAQLEEGTQATPYEPYFERTQTVYLNSPLLKGDEIVYKEGGLYHYHKSNIKKISISDVIGLNTTSYSNISYVKISIPNDYVNDKYIEGLLTADKFFTPSQQPKWDNASLVGAICSSAAKSQWWIGVTKTITLEQAKLLVDGTKVVYPISEPYYEPIQSDKLLLEIPNSATLSVESVIPCTSISATYTGNVPSLYSMENSILEIEEHNVDMVATTFDMDYRLLEVEWALEDAGLTGISLASTFNLNRKGEKTMALSRYEQAKIMILGGAYDKATLTKQLTRYLEKGLVTKEEYDELIALMEAKELVTGE